MGQGSQSVDQEAHFTPPPAERPTGSRMQSCACHFRNGCAGIGCTFAGQALMAFADTAIVLANLAANAAIVR